MRGSTSTNRRDSAALHPLGMPTPVAVGTDSSGHPRTLTEAVSHGAKPKWRRKHGQGRGKQPNRGRRPNRKQKPKRQVVQVREIWRIDDEWWRRPISRLYYQVVLDDGRVVVLYRDLIDGRWYLQ